MSRKIRWGILSTGSIAKKFAAGLKSSPQAELVAVGSRRKETADAFADEFDIPRRHASYPSLVADAEVDAIYVATPHPMHHDDAILCLEAGKAVLCEKPFAMNELQSREMMEVAERCGIFLMEAMWTRFLPYYRKMRELIADGAIGEVRTVLADFGFRAGVNPEGRLFSPALGGGGLLDVGVYTVALANDLLGEPEQVAALADIGTTGIDEQAACVLKYGGGRLASLFSAVRTSTPMEATVLGTEGHIRLEGPWWRGEKFTLCRAGKDAEQFHLPLVGNGYNYEADEVNRCLLQGRTQSETVPHADTLRTMRTLDRIRKQVGLTYPMEGQA